MGPPILLGGNVRFYYTNIIYLHPLQWGHRFYSVEILFLNTIKKSIKYSFNGATDFTRWKFQKDNGGLAWFKPASMGPPILLGGNLKIGIYVRIKPVVASMGPPILLGGNQHIANHCLRS